MTTTIAIIAMLIIIATLYFLQDTITEFLSGGKSFMPSEMKGYRNFNKGCFQTKRKGESATLPLTVTNKWLLLLIDTASVLLVLYIMVKIGSYILRTANII